MSVPKPLENLVNRAHGATIRVVALIERIELHRVGLEKHCAQAVVVDLLDPRRDLEFLAVART